MPLDERNVPLPLGNDGNEDVLTPQSSNRYPPPRYRRDNSPLPPDPPGREDIMEPDPRGRRAPR